MSKLGRHTTQLFVEPSAVGADSILLSVEEAHHALRVLRLREGDEIIAVDGMGGWYRATLRQTGSSRVLGDIVERRSEVGEPACALSLAVGLVKQPARMEMLVEKAVELGVTDLLWMQTARTERMEVNIQRLDRIARAALKQSGRSRVPRMGPPISFSEALSRLPRESTTLRLLCHEEADIHRTLASRVSVRLNTLHVAVLVGPEGGFSSEEVSSAEGNGIEVVSLGPRRLRTETAAIVAASLVMAGVDARSETGC